MEYVCYSHRKIGIRKNIRTQIQKRPEQYRDVQYQTIKSKLLQWIRIIQVIYSDKVISLFIKPNKHIDKILKSRLRSLTGITCSITFLPDASDSIRDLRA